MRLKAEKILALFLAAVMLCGATGVLAEEGQGAPLYATVGEAMEACPENRVIAGGVPEDYYAVVTEKDGKYYRSVAYYDETLNELYNTLMNLDYEAEDFFEKHEAASQAMDDYLKTLPIAYTEEFTAQPLTDEEMQAMVGKTLAQLTEEGFESGSNGTEPGEGDEILIVYSMRFGVYDYSCTVDADFDAYLAAQENGTEDSLTVKSVALAGITEFGFEKRFHTDGTVEEPEDPFADLMAVTAEFIVLLEKAQAGEEIDLDGFTDSLKEKYPDCADMIDTYRMLYETVGAEGLASLMSPAE